MKFKKHTTGMLVALLVVLCLSQSGCALIALPFKVAGDILSTTWEIIKRVPMPPPGVF